MDKTLQSALADFINQSLNAVKAGTDFLGAQLPDVIHQLIVYKTVSAGLGTLLGFCVLFGVPFIIYKMWKANIDTDVMIPVTIFGVLIGLAGGVGLLLGNIPNFIELLFAPKLYLIEYAASLLK